MKELLDREAKERNFKKRDLVLRWDTIREDKGKDEIAKVASNEVMICSFLLSDFENLMLSKPELAVSYTKFLGLKYKKIRNNYNNLINKDVKERLKLFLLDWIENEGVQMEDEWTLDNYLTQEDIAQIICTSRQTANKLFQNFENSGLISYNRKQIIIKDLEKLKQI